MRSDYLLWRPRQRKTICLFVLTLCLCLLFMAGSWSKLWDEHLHYLYPSYGDFFPLWSYAKIASTQTVTDLYDFNLIHTHQVALGMNPSLTNPFPYTPVSLLVLWPLDKLPYELSYVVWMTSTLGLFIWSVFATCSRSRLWWLVILIAPAVEYNIAIGQSGFLIAALMIAGIRLADDRPGLSGILTGILLAFKPQIALLIPVAYLARRNWTALGVSSATILAASVVSTVLFGWDVWPAWIAQLPTYSAWFDIQMGLHADIMPTVTANLRMLGLSSHVAQVIQLIAAAIVTKAIYNCFRQGPSRLTDAALLIGTFLATPHAVIYDTPMVVAALILFVEWCWQQAPGLRTTDIVCVVSVFLLSIGMVFSIPISSLVLMLMFCRILWLMNGLTTTRFVVISTSKRKALICNALSTP